LAQLIEAGDVMPIVDRTFPLDRVPDAMRYLEAGRVRGKVATAL
jgi:NADPH:quinone reductase-like Zn-dependent oxidoreductase